ncbi:pentapeptide repeat-containing protein [Actinomadura madurae]|uniref:pentapeptide repeat-containing protein n=1 Tax=Actinomadura madurae TaxID=1993 RepID=UPI00399B77ED
MLDGANLSAAILSSANLDGAILSGARLTRANLAGVRWTVPGTRWPAGLADTMRARSREIEPGVWEVVGVNGPDRALVPVS